MERIDTIVIGGGQAGLAMSKSLTDRGVEHVVLERGRVGERWRSERWDSLTLLTPRWLSRVAGWTDEPEADADGFMDRLEVVRYLDRFAYAHRAPVLEGVTVRSVRQVDSDFHVRTESGTWRARRVVVATGHSQDAFVPAMAGSLSREIHQVVPTAYRNPEQLPDGGVLVVGASATGIQLAQEIHASGRPVTLAVGRHTRLPRRYRGRDILHWLDDMGLLHQRTDAVRDLAASSEQPSMQLVGSADHRTLDLRVLLDEGVRLVGRAAHAQGRRVAFADDLMENVAAADWKLAGLRVRIDRHIRDRRLDAVVEPPEPFRPIPLSGAPEAMDLKAEGIRTVVWSTGFQRTYPWLHVPALDPRGEIRHAGGITTVPGLYAMGLNFQRRRSSSFLAGVARDADELADHMVLHTGHASLTRAVA